MAKIEKVTTAAAVTTNEAAKPTVFMEVFARGWKNTSQAGKEFITFRVNQDMAISLQAGDSMIVRANRKREGKKDADFVMGILPAA